MHAETVSRALRARAIRFALFTTLGMAIGGIALPLTPIWRPISNVVFGASTEDLLAIAQTEYDILTDIAHGETSELPFQNAESASDWKRYAPTIQQSCSIRKLAGNEQLRLERPSRRDQYLTPVMKVRLVDEISGQGGTVFFSFHKVDGEWQVDSVWQPASGMQELQSCWVNPNR